MLVQKAILKGISELLYNHDYVVVPGFGGFVSRSQASHYSLNKEVLFPPSKSIVFNVQLKQNDGVLANWLKEEVKCDFIQATKHLEEFAAHCKMLLDTKRRLEFENLGLFYVDFENNICFEPKTDVNFLIDSFGLSSITLKELPVEETVVVKHTFEPQDRLVKAEASDKLPVRKTNYKRIAALAIGIPVIGFALLFAVKQMQPNSNSFAAIFGGGSHANYTPVNYNSKFTELELSQTSNYVVDANGYAGITLFEDKHVAVNIHAVNTTSHSVNTNMSHVVSSGRYQVVMGCFSVKANARKMIKKLAAEKLNATISGTNAKGMYVVSSGGFDDKESAVNLLQSIKSKYPSAWVMTQE